MNKLEMTANRLAAGAGDEIDLATARERLRAVAAETATTVGALLTAVGWNGDGTPSDATIAAAIEMVKDVRIDEGRAAESVTKTPALRDLRLNIGTMMTTEPEPIDMVLRGLPLGSVGVILGSGGVGKSMLVLHVAHAVATGHDDLGCLLDDGDRTTGRVVYLAGEDDDLVIHHRLRAFANHLEPERRDENVRSMAERVDIVPLVGCAPSLLDGAGRLNAAAIAQVREAARGTRLLVIDPFRQFHSGDENDNGAMTTLIKALAQIAHEEHCTIIIVHHVSKAGAKDEEGDAAMSRGATAITDNARWVMALGKISDAIHERLGLPGESWRYLRTRRVKANYAALGGVTILVRSEGGVLAPMPTPAACDMVETIAQMTGHALVESEPVYDDGESLDPRTGDAFPQQPRGYEDRDLFGAA